MTGDFPLDAPTTKAEFQRSLRALIEAADAAGVDVENGWGFRTDGSGWSIEIHRLAEADGSGYRDGGGDSGVDTSTLDDLFGALSHPQRRRILTTLWMEPSLSVGGLAPEEGTATDGASSRRRVALHTVHLPRLDDAGYVDWDRTEGTVERGPRYEEVRALVQVLVREPADLLGD